MPIQHALWTVSQSPQMLAGGKLQSEQLLQDMILAEPRILSPEWMLIGKEVIEYFVPVQWIKTVEPHHAIQEVGVFGNQNTACRPRTPACRTTVGQLKTRFNVQG
ncbi:hypothetical protein [Luteimonas sp. e5]